MMQNDNVFTRERKKPKLSVIVPAYNSAAYIRKGLDSIASQTLKDYELIVVCDRCLDDTARIASEYGARVFEVDFGRDGLSRDFGIDHAEGEWVMFMDDDDWFMHEYVFQLLMDIVGKHDEDILMFAYIWRGIGFTKNSTQFVQVHAWSKCYRRSFLGDDVRFGDRPYWSDTDFFNRVMAKHPSATFVDMPMYYYNSLRRGSTTDKFERGEIQRIGREGPVRNRLGYYGDFGLEQE